MIAKGMFTTIALIAGLVTLTGCGIGDTPNCNPEMGVTCWPSATSARPVVTTTTPKPLTTTRTTTSTTAAPPSTYVEIPLGTQTVRIPIPTDATIIRPVPTTTVPITRTTAPTTTTVTTTTAPPSRPQPITISAGTDVKKCNSTPLLLDRQVTSYGTTVVLKSHGRNGGPELVFGGPVDFTFPGAIVRTNQITDEFSGYSLSLNGVGFNGSMVGTGNGQSLDFDFDVRGEIVGLVFCDAS